MTTPTPAAATVADDPLPTPAAVPEPVRYRPNRHERRRAEALKRKAQKGRQ